MESANSGSMQSSSCGDEEYDSSAFFNSSISTPLAPPPQAPPTHHIPTNQPPLFDPQFNYFTSFPQPANSSNSVMNLDMLWSDKTLTSQQPNCTPLLGSSNPNPNPPLQTPLPQAAARPCSSTSDQTRVSKKRSRASRRAPTTVLTTDTSNFRAMVQEFTGIPAPPFAAAARTRLDLFNPRPQPPYLLRPFAQKFQPLQPYGIASSATNLSSVANTSNPNSTTTNNNYHLLSDQLGFPKQSQNPTLTFQSLLKSSPNKYPLSNSLTFNGKAPGLSSTDSNPTMGLFQEFNMNQGNATTHPTDLSNLQEMIPKNSSSNWEDQVHLRSFGENYDHSSQQARGGNCKMNSSLEFHVEKTVPVMDNTPSRGGEGMMDSWIRNYE